MSKTIEVRVREELILDNSVKIIQEMMEYRSHEQMTQRHVQMQREANLAIQNGAFFDSTEELLDHMIRERNTLLGFIGRLQGLYPELHLLNEKLKAAK